MRPERTAPQPQHSGLPETPAPVARSISQEQRKGRELPALPGSLGVPIPFLAVSTEA